MSHYSTVCSRRSILYEWCKSSSKNKQVLGEWVKTDLNILITKRRFAKDMNLVDAWV